jgi:hypothetical protein
VPQVVELPTVKTSPPEVLRAVLDAVTILPDPDVSWIGHQ